MVDDVPSTHLDLRLPAQPSSVARARKLLEGVPGLAPHAGLMLDMRLALSEMVTNGIVHGASGVDDEIEVLINVDGRRVRMEVCDPGSGFTPPSGGLPAPTSTAGRGLHLVDALASRWGVEVHSGTRVWAEFDLARLDG